MLKSTEKRVKTSEKSREANKAVKSRITTIFNKLQVAISEGNKAETKEIFRLYSSILDKAVKKGVIKKNAANRRKSRVSAKLAILS